MFYSYKTNNKNSFWLKQFLLYWYILYLLCKIIDIKINLFLIWLFSKNFSYQIVVHFFGFNIRAQYIIDNVIMHVLIMYIYVRQCMKNWKKSDQLYKISNVHKILYEYWTNSEPYLMKKNYVNFPSYFKIIWSKYSHSIFIYDIIIINANVIIILH